jgi:HEAT repeat protein
MGCGMIGKHKAVVALVVGLLFVSIGLASPRLRAEYYYLRILNDPYDHHLFNRLWFLRDSATPTLIRLLQHDVYLTRQRAAEGLKRARDPEAVGALLEAARNDSSRSVRDSAILSLGFIGDERALPVLKQLSHENATALEALTRLGTRGERAVLEVYSDHPDPSRRARALAVLCDLPMSGVNVANEVKNGLRDPSYDVRLQSIRCAPSVLRTRAIDLLEAVTHDPDPTLRLEATYQLSKLGNSSALYVASEILLDESLPSEVRSRAAWVLAQTGDARALPSLEKARRSDDWLVKRRASSSFLQLQHQLGKRDSPEPVPKR